MIPSRDEAVDPARRLEGARNRMSSRMNAVHDASLEGTLALEQADVTSDEVLAEALNGSHVAFAKLYTIYSKRLYRTIIAITRDSQDAEDALQETFLRAYLALHTFEGRSNISSWLTRIAINSALLILRRRRARPEILFDPQPDSTTEAVVVEIKDSAPNPEEVYAQGQRRLILSRALRSLNPHLLSPLQMQMRTGSSMKEIGRALNISEAAVKTRIHRARVKLSTSCGQCDCWTSKRPNIHQGSVAAKKGQQL
jgi:RNA polymerase sigma-70 factor (ECF subfamily)